MLYVAKLMQRFMPGSLTEKVAYVRYSRSLPLSDLPSLVAPTPITMAATRKVADHTLYHLNPKGFWKKFRALFDALAALALCLTCTRLWYRRCCGSKP